MQNTKVTGLKKKKFSWKSIIVIVITVVIFLYMGRILIKNWVEIPFERLRLSYPSLVISFILLLCRYPCVALGWKNLLHILGEEMPFKKSMTIIGITQIGRFIPGKVWLIAGRVYIANKEGISTKKALISMILENIFGLLAAFILFILGGHSIVQTKLLNKVYLLLIFIPVCLVIIHPFVFKRIINLLLKIMKKKPVEFEVTYKQILVGILPYLLAWVLMGAGFYFLIRSFFFVSLSKFLALVGTWALAWMIGFLSFVTPGGLGIREGALSYLLALHMPSSIAIISALASRVWGILGSIIIFAIFAKNLRSMTK